jgi:hypothetical protein
MSTPSTVPVNAGLPEAKRTPHPSTAFAPTFHFTALICLMLVYSPRSYYAADFKLTAPF